MLLVNLQLATTSTVDGFQPVIEVAVTYEKSDFNKKKIIGSCYIVIMSVI